MNLKQARKDTHFSPHIAPAAGRFLKSMNAGPRGSRSCYIHETNLNCQALSDNWNITSKTLVIKTLPSAAVYPKKEYAESSSSSLPPLSNPPTGRGPLSAPQGRTAGSRAPRER